MRHQKLIYFCILLVMNLIFFSKTLNLFEYNNPQQSNEMQEISASQYHIRDNRFIVRIWGKDKGYVTSTYSVCENALLAK